MNQKLQSEQVAEFDYRPARCKKAYRMVVVRKNITKEKGEERFFDEIRYFFYITNDRQRSATRIVFGCNDRCNQESLIAQQGAGIPYKDENGDDYDFHALRHQFITDLARAGVSLNMAKELARHSKVDLTANIYTHLSDEDKSKAVEKLGQIRKVKSPLVEGLPGEAVGEFGPVQGPVENAKLAV